MKKFFLMMSAIIALSLVSCDNSNAYKAKGEQMAKQLDQLCEQHDSAAVLALDDSIRAQEAAIIAKGDSVAIAAFREALKESRERNAPFISTLKVSHGMSDEEVAKEIINDVMEGDMSINAVTESIDEMLKNKK
ncbi:MAG: hypothetical protein IKI10_01925 [Muribaculaceae bacterium]|nr:hypothetical protein [Muribaculaceae bacterium]